MGDDRLENRPDAGIPAHATPEERRLQALCRQLFRDMVRQQVSEEPLSAYRRRLLVRYGASLGLGELESRLIVRGVEYESGQAESEALPDETPPNPNLVADIDSHQGAFLLAVILLLGILLGLTLLSLR